MPRSRTKVMKPIHNDGSPDVPLQFDVKKSVEDSKIVKPSDVFEGFTKKNNKRRKSK